MNEFIILDEKEFSDVTTPLEESQVESLDLDLLDEYAYECQVYGTVLVENEYAEAVTKLLNECGYDSYSRSATANCKYVILKKEKW